MKTEKIPPLSWIRCDCPEHCLASNQNVLLLGPLNPKQQPGHVAAIAPGTGFVFVLHEDEIRLCTEEEC